MSERSAQGIRGFLLYDVIRQQYFFRVYGKRDSESVGKYYKDYEISAEDIEIEIQSDDISIYESEDSNRLDWSSKVIGEI
jgi:hypothetical protein